MEFSRRQLEHLGEPINPVLPTRWSPICGGGGGKGGAKAPDYKEMAAASREAAQLGHQLGTAQLDEAKRQYDLNYGAIKPIVDSQIGLMDETTRQGRDYYEYGKEGRPVERAMNAQSMVDNTAADAAERDAITGGAAEIEAGRYGGDIRYQTDQAVADARQGTTAQMNQLIRQGLRYGYSPAAMAQRLQPAALQSGLGVASAANQARQGAIAGARGLMTTGRNMRLQDTAIDWARKLDVAGLYRGMPGASQGAYGLALGSGNSASGNQMVPGNALMTGMAQGAGIQQTGKGQQLQGLGQVLNAQTSAYNASNNQGGGLMGGLIGAGAQLGAAYMMSGSDRRLKHDIRLVGRDARTDLNLYEFSYKVAPSRRYVGVMADEVEPRFPNAVVYDVEGYAFVNYGMLGLEMTEAHHGH